MLQIATDTGGTFTDLILETPDGLRQFKASTTPDDPIRGVLNVVDLAAADLGISRRDLLSNTEYLFHATTRAINAILTGTAAKTAFLTTEGHPDILLFREGGRLGTFDFTRSYSEPYVPRSLTYEVRERVSSEGAVLRELDQDDLVPKLRDMRARGVEALAVCLLWSPVNPVHELQVGQLIEAELPGVPYTLSHRLNPTIREYRRASGTAIDASLKPLMSRYLVEFEDRLRSSGFDGRLLVVTSSGGMLDASDVAAAPIHAIGSGPAMAPIAGRFYALRDLGAQEVIVADTGGTTFDVSLVRRGRIPSTRETWLGPMYSGHITGFASVDVRSIGAGGGSVAWVDEGGLLHVGPESAGAVPGPACYGLGGTRPTVTDACVALGYLHPAQFLGGSMPLDADAALAALAHAVGEPLSVEVQDAAAAVLELATEHQVAAIEQITLKQGVDPRNAVLVAGGGAAGLNAVAIARRLGCETVLIPAVGPVLSASGALMSDMSRDIGAAFYTTTADFDYDGVNATLQELARRCQQFIADTGSSLDSSEIRYLVEARYPSQVYELDLPLSSINFTGEEDTERLCADFHRLHEEIFSICDPTSHVEIMGWRAQVTCQLNRRDLPGLTHRPTEERGARLAYFGEEGLVETRVVDFESFPKDFLLHGPAIIESALTTVVVPPGTWAERTETGGIALRSAEEHRSDDLPANAQLNQGGNT